MSTDDFPRRLASLVGVVVLVGLVASTSEASVGPITSAPPTPSPDARPAATAPVSPAGGAAAGRVPARKTTVPEVPTVDAGLRPAADRSRSEPRRLEIAGVDIDVSVVPVGVTKAGDMALPDTNRKAGWYEYGPRPADRAGVGVFAAHVDTRSEGLGPFAKLRWASKGSVVAVTDDDGRVHRYRVTDVDRTAKGSAALRRVFERSGAPRVVIITCGGAYDQRSGYADNVVVTAAPES